MLLSKGGCLASENTIKAFKHDIGRNLVCLKDPSGLDEKSMFFQAGKIWSTRSKPPGVVENLDYSPVVRKLCHILQLPEPAPQEIEKLTAEIKDVTDLLGVVEKLEQAAGEAEKNRKKKLFVDPGHYYSPIVDPSILRQPWKRNSTLPPEQLRGIRLSREQHLVLFGKLLPYLLEHPFTDKDDSANRYHFGSENDMFPYTDGLILHALIRHYKPKKVVEIGSGYSSACIVDTIDGHSPSTQCTFIEPYPKRLKRLLREADLTRFTLFECPVQQAPLNLFEELSAGDFLFIDSTHVLKTGSDLVFELFEVLPRIQSGVLIHFHDIFYPFEYTAHWAIEQNRSWNEAYALRAFLTDNPNYEILFFSDYFVNNCCDELEHSFPSFLRTVPGSLWLVKR
jgi:predicted O-methyltransferase YrrM